MEMASLAGTARKGSAGLSPDCTTVSKASPTSSMNSFACGTLSGLLMMLVMFSRRSLQRWGARRYPQHR